MYVLEFGIIITIINLYVLIHYTSTNGTCLRWLAFLWLPSTYVWIVLDEPNHKQASMSHRIYLYTLTC